MSEGFKDSEEHRSERVARQELNISILLPDEMTVYATGIVIWDDHHGKTGINFQFSDPEMRRHFDSWLDLRFINQIV